MITEHHLFIDSFYSFLSNLVQKGVIDQSGIASFYQSMLNDSKYDPKLPYFTEGFLHVCNFYGFIKKVVFDVIVKCLPVIRYIIKINFQNELNKRPDLPLQAQEAHHTHACVEPFPIIIVGNIFGIQGRQLCSHPLMCDSYLLHVQAVAKYIKEA